MATQLSLSAKMRLLHSQRNSMRHPFKSHFGSLAKFEIVLVFLDTCTTKTLGGLR
jgi:hypothetical protein